LAISGVAIITCAVIGFLPERWRRALRRRRRGLGDRVPGSTGQGRTRSSASAAVTTSTARQAASAGSDLSARPEGPPQLAWPWRSPDRRPSLWVSVLLVVVSGVAAGAISYPLVGVGAAALVAVALVVPRARAVTSVLAVGLLVAAGASVVAGQWLHPLSEGSNWPSAFPSASVLTWMAVVFLGADAVVETARRLSRRSTTTPAE